MRDCRDVGRRTAADVVERHAVEVGVPLEFVGASTAKTLSLVAEKSRDEIAGCRTQVVYVRNVQRRRPVKHLTTVTSMLGQDRNRKFIWSPFPVFPAPRSGLSAKGFGEEGGGVAVSSRSHFEYSSLHS